MKKNYTYFILIALSVLSILSLISYQAITYTGGPSGGLTNAPGENNCTSCHSGTLITSGTNWGNITLTTNIPGTGYLPDSVYTITLEQSFSGISKWGFQVTCLTSSNNSMAGSFTITNSTRTQKVTASSKEYVTHTSSGTSGSGSNSWSFNWKAPSTNVGDVKFYATTNAANGNSMTSGDQIFAKNWTFNVSSLLPTATITPSKSIICVGDTLFLTGGGSNNPTSYSWTMTGGNPSSSSVQNPWVVYTTSGTKTISLTTTNSKGKSSPASINISVNALPSANISISGKTSLCTGDSVVLTAPQGNGLTYLWNTNDKTRSITVKTAGNYYVTVTNASGCKAVSQTVKVEVFTVASNILKVSVDSICSGENVTLNSTTGFKSYSFFDGTKLIYNGKDNSFITSSLSNGNDLYAVATDSNGCNAKSNKLSVVVQSPSKATIVSCKNVTTNSIEFEWKNINGAIAYEVSTDSGKNWKNNGLNTNYLVSNLNYSTDIHLSVRAIENTKCKYSEIGSTMCQTLPCSPINFSLEIDSTICQNDSALIYVRNIDIKTYAINFNNSGYSKDTIFYVKPSANNSYSMLVIDSNALNCPPIQKNISINVENLNLVLSNNTTDNAICEGENIEFSSTKGFSNYEFFINSKSVSIGNSSVYSTSSLTNQDEVSVKAISQLGCSYTSNIEKITVHSIPMITLTSNKLNETVCKGDEVEFTAKEGLVYYAFTNGNDTFNSGQNHKVKLTSIANNDEIKVFAIDTNGCQAKSNTLVMKVNELPKPGFTLIQNNISVNFSDTTSKVKSRIWDFGDLSNDTTKNPVHTYAIAGDYLVKLSVNDINNCSESTQRSIKVSSSGIQTLQNQQMFSVYVNNSTKNIIYEFKLNETSDVIITLYNANGQYVTAIENNSYEKGKHSSMKQMNNLSKGIYYVLFQSGSNSIRQKIVIH